MERYERIAFIGAGHLAEALIKGLLANAILDSTAIHASAPRAERREELQERFGISVYSSNEDAAGEASIIVLCVKPQILPGVLGDLTEVIGENVLVVTVAAGIPISLIESRFRSAVRVVRAMPNVAVVVGAGVTAISAGSSASEDDLRAACSLFDSVGRTVVVDERHLDTVTGLSGSGPAYLLLVLEALSDAGVKLGLSRSDSLSLAAQTMLGTARLLIETGEHPAVLRESVTSPGGTAITGLHELERAGVRAAMVDAVEAATRRASELGAKHRIEPELRSEERTIVPVAEERWGSRR